jgi:histidyl-tRNA synthetase
VLGPEAKARAVIEAKAQAILQGAGYQRIETPCFEATELFSRGVGESSDIVKKEMYTFTDGSGRSLTLRPEGTAPVCRAYVQHGMHKRPQPVKLWYLSSFFRYERAQKGRYRQFWQVGAEALGSEDPALDAESILLLHRLLSELGARDLRLRLSSLGSQAARVSYRQQLAEHLRSREGELSEDVRDRIDLNPLRAFDSEHPGTVSVMKDAPLLLEHLQAEDLAHFEQVKELLSAAEVPYEIDPTLVRGLDYYTRTVFEFTSQALGAQSGVGGGGRYDGLVQQLGGPSTPGIGWAAGIERMLLAGSLPSAAEPELDLYVCLHEGDEGKEGLAFEGERAGLRKELRRRAFQLLWQARSAGLQAEMEMAGRSLSGQLKQANRHGARFAAIIDAGCVTLRDMQDGEQSELEDDRVVHELLRRLRTLT